MNLVKINSIDEIKVGDIVLYQRHKLDDSQKLKLKISGVGEKFIIGKFEIGFTEKSFIFNEHYFYKEQNRYRAKIGEEYFGFDNKLRFNSFFESCSPSDEIRYNLGNYFRTKEQMQEAVDEIKKKLDELHLKFSEEK